jgi:hypothetical protein
VSRDHLRRRHKSSRRLAVPPGSLVEVIRQDRAALKKALTTARLAASRAQAAPSEADRAVLVAFGELAAPLEKLLAVLDSDR